MARHKPNRPEAVSTQIVGYFLDAFALGFIAIGLENLQKDGFGGRAAGNLFLGFSIGLCGIFWERLAMKLPEKFVTTAVAVASDFRWWLVAIIVTGLSFNLPDLNQWPIKTITKTITRTAITPSTHPMAPTAVARGSVGIDSEGSGNIIITEGLKGCGLQTGIRSGGTANQINAKDSQFADACPKNGPSNSLYVGHMVLNPAAP